MKSQSLQTTKFARYCTLGELTRETEEIVFVFHGYGQLASDFIKNFESLHSKKRFIIAPEGLSKFYIKGFFGKIGASWMTKEDRTNEIHDYLNLFDNIYSQYSTRTNKNTKTTLFGFSQGGAAASRWFVNSDLPNASLILWGSSLPPDIDYNRLRNKLIKPVKIVIGDNDEFISQERLVRELKVLEKERINFELKKYPGKHNIQPGLLKTLNLFF